MAKNAALLGRQKTEQARMLALLQKLKLEYPEAKCSLEYKNPFELLIATILSAQCTDKKVNQVTPELFKKFPDAFMMAKAQLETLQGLIKPTGFYINKSKSLLGASRALVDRFEGKVPQDLTSLVGLPGVGKKTANVVLGNAWKTPAPETGIVVDTHVSRIAYRLGFTLDRNPLKSEKILLDLVPREDRVVFSHILIAHGRALCTARQAKCTNCPINSLCKKRGV